MTKHQKDIMWLMLQPDYYLIQSTNVRGRTIFKVYDSNHTPVQYFYGRQVKKFNALFKTDHKKRITLNLNLVRQLRGNTHLKTLYKKYRSYGQQKVQDTHKM